MKLTKYQSPPYGILHDYNTRTVEFHPPELHTLIRGITDGTILTSHPPTKDLLAAIDAVLQAYKYEPNNRFLYKVLIADKNTSNKIKQLNPRLFKKARDLYDKVSERVTENIQSFFKEIDPYIDITQCFYTSSIEEQINKTLPLMSLEHLAWAIKTIVDQGQSLNNKGSDSFPSGYNFFSADVKLFYCLKNAPKDILSDIEKIAPGSMDDLKMVCAASKAGCTKDNWMAHIGRKIGENQAKLEDIPKKYLPLVIAKMVDRYRYAEIPENLTLYQISDLISAIVFFQELFSAKDLIKKGYLHNAKVIYNNLKDFAVKKLIQVIESNEKGTEAVRMLGKIKDPKAQAFLIQLLENPPTQQGDFNKQIRAAYALCEQGYASSVKPLAVFVTKLIENTAENTFVYCDEIISSMGIEIEGQEATDFLIRLSKHPNNMIKRAVVKALARRKELGVVELLIELSRPPLCSRDDKQEYLVQRAAIQALGRMNNSVAIKPLEEIVTGLGQDEIQERIDIIGSLGDLGGGKDTAQFLLGLLNTTVVPVQVAVINALGKIKDPIAVEPLIKILETNDEPGILCPTIRALRQIKDTRAVPQLIGVLKSNLDLKIKTEASVALGEIGDPVSVEPLQELLKELTDTHKVVESALGKVQQQKQ